MAESREEKAAEIDRAEQRAAWEKRKATRKLLADRRQRKEDELQRKLSQPYLLAPPEVTWRDRLLAFLAPILVAGFFALASLAIAFRDYLP
jgi:hypothetical protein